MFQPGAGFDSDAIANTSHQHFFSTQHGGDVVVVPDAELLFAGHYQRAGNDLILFNEDRRYVVSNYFIHDRHPGLVSPDGAGLSGHIVELLAGVAPPTQYAQAGSATAGHATAIGHIEKVSGFVTVMRNGVAANVNVGDLVFKDDVIETGADSAAGMSFIDGTAFSLSARARIVLNEFVYDANGSSNEALITLVQGTFSFVAGKVAKTGDMKVDTPIATMGIRGTAVEVNIPIDITATNGTVQFSVMVEPDGTTGSYEILDRLTGTTLAIVNQSDLVWLVTPTAPGQPPTITTEVKTAYEIAIEQQAVQQVFQYSAHSLEEPVNPNSLPTPGSSTPPQNLNENLNENPNENLLTLQTPFATITTAFTNGSNLSPASPVPLPFRSGVFAPPVFDLAVQITRIAISANGLGGAANSFDPSISADGQFVVFDAASSLPTGVTGASGASDVFLYDRTSETITSLTVGHITNAPADESYSEPSISLDGDFVVFQGQNQSGSQSGAQPDIYIYDRSTNQTALLADPTTNAAISGSAAHISADGQFIVMQQVESGVLHSLIVDRNGTVLDNISSDGGASSVNSPNISANGRYVTFWSTGSEIDVTAANGTVVQASSMASGTAELYVFDRVTDTVRPVAILYSGSPSNAAELASSASMSADGRYIVFASDAENPLVPGGNEPYSSIFIYDLTTGTIRNLSLADNGGTANGDSVMPQISADGLFVTFASSASNLVPGENTGSFNTFLYNLATNSIELVSATAGGLPGNNDSSFGSAVSSDGIIVSFGSTASNLMPGNSNGKADVYIADESGGTMGTVVDDPFAQTLTTHGTIQFSGAQGDAYTVSVTAEAGALGTLSAIIIRDPTEGGSGGLIQWTYQVAETQAATLAAGQSEVNTFSIGVNDGDGGIASQNVTVTIIGTRPLIAEPVFWTNGAGGEFGSAANWSTSTVPGAADQVLIDHAGTYTVTSDLDQTISTLGMTGNATLSLTDATFAVTSETSNAGIIAIGSGATLDVFSTVENSGVIQLDQDNGSNAASLQINGYVSLSGGGDITLTDQAHNTIFGIGAGATLENIDNTIAGSGLLGDGNLTLLNGSAGTIDAAGTTYQLIIDTGGNTFTNNGVLEATGAAGMLVQNTIVINNNVLEVLDSSTIEVNATVDNTYFATIEIGGTLASDAASFSATMVTNEDVITVSDHGTFKTTDLANGGPILLDEGTIEINDFGALNSEVITNAYYGIIAVNNNGTLNAGSLTNAGFLNVYDDGSVHDTVMDNSVDVTINNNAAIYNTSLIDESTGYITLSNSSTMQDGSDTNSGQIALYDNSTVIDEVLDNTNVGYIDLYNDTTLTVTGAAGTSENAGSIFIGNFAAGEDVNLSIGGTFSNSGYIELDGSGYAEQTIAGAAITILAGSATLEGGGQISLLGGVITGAAGGATLTNVDNIISGFGSIGDGASDLTLVNEANGVIDGNNIAMTLNTGSNLISNAGTIEASLLGAVNILSPISNTGTLQAISDASLNVEASLDNSGTVAAYDGSSFTITGVTTNDGTIAADSLSNGTIEAKVDNSGALQAMAGGTLNLLSDLDNTGSLLAQDGNLIAGGAVSGSGQAQIADGVLTYDGSSTLATDFATGTVGGLKLAHSGEFSGTVTGFASGDYYDLMDINNSQATFYYVSNNTNTGGTLYVSDGANSAAISMIGQYTTASFFASGDNSGGTYIAETMPVRWLNATSGIFEDVSNWESGSVPNSGNDVFITAAGEDYTVTVTSSSAQTVNSISVGADATLAIGGMGGSSTFAIANGTELGSILGQVDVNDGSELALHFQVQNSGLITLDSTGDDTTLSIIGTTTLDGSGEVTLSDNENNVITGTTANATLINVDNLISGSGLLGDGQLTLVNGGDIAASGEINPLIINTEGNVVINNGTLEATGVAGLVIENSTVDSSGGGLVDGVGGPVELQSGWLIGGTLNGQIDVSNGLNTLDGTDGRTVTIDATGNVALLDGQQLTLRGSIGNSGTIALDASSNATTLLIDTANVSLSGGGAINLSDSSDNIITGTTADATLTNVDDTISGSGLLGDGQLTLINEAKGFIDATGETDPLVVNTKGEVLVNDGTLEAVGAAGLEIEDTTVNGSLGFIGNIIAYGGSLVDLESAIIFGGTLMSYANGVMNVVQGTDIFDGANDSSATNSGMTNSADVEVLDGQQLTLRGEINNSDYIGLDSTGDTTTLLIDSTNVSLNGYGTINLSDQSGNVITGVTASATLTNNDNTISGSGQLGNGQLTLINGQYGNIDATGDVNPLIINTQGNAVINYGTLQATGAAGLLILDTTVDSSGGGFVSLSASGGPVELQGAVLVGGSIEGLINVIGGLSILDGTDGKIITIAATGDVEVLDGQQLTLRGSIDDSGVINLDSSGDATTLWIDTTNASLSGGGSIKLSDLSNNIITGVTANATLTNDDTITGSGLVGDGQLTLINDGIIDASGVNTPLVLDTAGSAVTNDGTLEATGTAGLLIENTTINGSGGGVIDGNGGVVELLNDVIAGGTLEGSITLGDTASTLDGTQYVVASTGHILVNDGDELVLMGIINNTGTIALDGQGDATMLEIGAANATLAGGGQITLSDATANYIVGVSASATLTIANTLVGSGELGDGELTLINENSGTIDADNATPLVINTQGNIATNDGIFEASAGGQLIILNTTVDGSGGGFIEANGANSVVELQSADLLGGTLATSDAGSISVVDTTFDGTQNKPVNNTGDVTVSDGQQLTLLGIINNTGSIDITASGDDTTLSIAGAVTLEGGGGLMLSDDTHNIIEGNAAGAALTNQDNTIFGAGSIGGGNLTLINQLAGDIDASATAPLDLNFQVNPISNAGVLQATGTGGLDIQGDVQNASSGLIEANHGDVLVAGDVTGGSVGIVDATIEVTGALSAEVTFYTSTGMLKLDAPSMFSGKIAGFTGNGTLAGSDQIDLAGINETAADFHASYDKLTGILVVTDGTNTADLKFVGIYSQDNFQFTTDNDGGAIIYDPPTANRATATVGTTSGDAFVFHPAMGTSVLANVSSHNGMSDRVEPDDSSMQLQQLMRSMHLADDGNDFILDHGYGDVQNLHGLVRTDVHTSDFILH